MADSDTEQRESRQEEEDEQESRQEEEDEQESREEEPESKEESRSDDESDSKGEDDFLKDQLIRHLRDVHAIEEQALKQLERAVELSEDEELKKGYQEHAEQSREHEEAIRERIHAHDLEPSAVQDLTMRSGAVGLRQLAEIPPDTPIKLAMHMYAFEHLEIAAYEFLGRIAKEAGDDDTAKTAEEIMEQEREEAERVFGTFDHCCEEGLKEPSGEEREESGDGEESDEQESDGGQESDEKEESDGGQDSAEKADSGESDDREESRDQEASRA